MEWNFCRLPGQSHIRLYWSKLTLRTVLRSLSALLYGLRSKFHIIICGWLHSVSMEMFRQSSEEPHGEHIAEIQTRDNEDTSNCHQDLFLQDLQPVYQLNLGRFPLKNTRRMSVSESCACQQGRRFQVSGGPPQRNY